MEPPCRDRSGRESPPCLPLAVSTRRESPAATTLIEIEHLDFFYGATQALQ